MDEVKSSLVALIREVILGAPPGESGTWFVQGNEALLTTLNNLSAAQASIRLGGKASSIAAHVIHSTYYVQLAVDGLAGVERDGDWAGSWATQVVDDDQWAACRDLLVTQVDRLLEGIKEVDLQGNPEDLTYALANLGHLAYHLGAIRQLYLLVCE